MDILISDWLFGLRSIYLYRGLTVRPCERAAGTTSTNYQGTVLKCAARAAVDQPRTQNAETGAEVHKNHLAACAFVPEGVLLATVAQPVPKVRHYAHRVVRWLDCSCHVGHWRQLDLFFVLRATLSTLRHDSVASTAQKAIDSQTANDGTWRIYNTVRRHCQQRAIARQTRIGLLQDLFETLSCAVESCDNYTNWLKGS